MFASVTRLRIKSVRNFPAFMWGNLLVKRQVESMAGFSGGRLLIDANRTFWTLTVWKTEQAMKAFRGSGAHVRLMPKLQQWSDESAYAHWITSGSDVPTWQEAYVQLIREGRLSRVTNPSPKHVARQFAPPRLQPLIGVDLKPKAPD